MTVPALLFGALLASLLGALYHLALGGPGSRLIVYLLLAWAGFALGHLAGVLFGWNFLQAGPLHVGPAVISALVFLGVGDWLTRTERPA